MARNNQIPGPDLPNIADPSEVVDGLEPEIVDGPLGVPMVKPKGLDTPDELNDPMEKMGRY